MSKNTAPKSFTVDLTDTAKAVVRFARKGEPTVYLAYIAEHGVTAENVGEHVQSLATLAESIAPWEDKAERKNFCNKVRNGLNRNLPKPVATDDETSADETDDETETDETSETAENVDYLALAVQAAATARANGVSADEILSAVAAVLA